MSDTKSDEELEDTAAKLDTALDSATDEEHGEPDQSDSAAFIEDMQRGLRDGLLESLGVGASESTGDGLGEQFGRLLGEMVVRKLTEQLRGIRGSEREADTDDLLDQSELLEGDGETLSGDVVSAVAEDIGDVQEVTEETGELLETVDVTELPEAIDLSELPEAIDFEEVPAAIANADPKRAVELKQLASLVDFSDLWNAVDVREFMRNKDELEDAVGDVTGDDDGDSTDTSSLTDSLGSSGSSGSSEPSESSESSSAGEGGAELGGEKAQAMQTAIQSKLRDSVEEFRDNVLDARGQVKDARDTAQETVEEKTGGGMGQPDSRNPTAYSTMVSGWKTGDWSSAMFSTVPQDTQHSSAPGHFRIYGRRFDEREDEDE